MLGAWPPWLTGLLTASLLLLNTLLIAVPVYCVILAKLLSPAGSRSRARWSARLAWLAQRWAHLNAGMASRLLPIRWDIRSQASVQRNGRYLVCANHQSWNDILVLFKAFGRDAPFFKFFLKRELVWVPILGPIWWGLDYPFMRRHSAAQLASRPELRGQDLAATRRACEAFSQEPALILNFLEGTRFTAAKRQLRKSPYRHLLPPKSGGLAFVLDTLGDRVQGLIDVTIVYPDGAGGLWDFLCGRVRRVIVELREVDIPDALRNGDYQHDEAFRRQFQAWIADIWAAKDRRIEALMAQA